MTENSTGNQTTSHSYHRLAKANFAVAATFLLYFVGIFQVVGDKLADLPFSFAGEIEIHLPTYHEALWMSLLIAALGIPLAVMGGFLAETAAHFIEKDDPHPGAEKWGVLLCETSGMALVICTGVLFYAMHWTLAIAYLIAAVAALAIMMLAKKPKGKGAAEG